PASKATGPSPSVARSRAPETTLVSSASVPRLASSSQISMPARLPVVTDVQASAAPGLVSTTFRSGLRKFTGAKRPTRLPLSVNFPCHIVSRPRPRYSAPCQVTRTRAPRSEAAKGRAVCTTLAPCSTSRRSIGAVPMTSAASRIGAEPATPSAPKQRLRGITIELRETEIDALIRKGLLKSETLNDRSAILRAIYEFLDLTLDTAA